MESSTLFDLDAIWQKDNAYRLVLTTTNRSQGVIMSLPSSQEIGLERHDGDQHIYIVEGSGIAILGNSTYNIHSGVYILIPGDTWHNIINTGDRIMRLLTVYTPSEHSHNTYQSVRPEED